MNPALHASLMQSAQSGNVNELRQLMASSQFRSVFPTFLKESSVRDILLEAAAYNQVPIVDYCLTELHAPYLADHVDEAVVAAARNGHTELVRHLIDTYKATNLDLALDVATGNGREGVVQLLMETYGCGRSLETIRRIHLIAARYGQMAMTRALSEILISRLSATASSSSHQSNETIITPHQVIRDAMIAAAKGGQYLIVDWCYQECVNHDMNPPVEDAIVAAARHGHAAVVRLCREKYSAINDALLTAFVAAACRGHTNVVRLCFEFLNTRIFDEVVVCAFVGAASNGQTEMVRMFLTEWYSPAIAEARKQATHQAIFENHMDTAYVCENTASPTMMTLS